MCESVIEVRMPNINAALGCDYRIMTRPVWQLMNRLEMFKECETDRLENTLWLEERIVDIPSSVKL